MKLNDQRLIERGFPCHQVGAETGRERDTGKAPPVNRLHVWWARRPLTPSRAAIVASLDSADTDPDAFLRQLGIEKVQALVNGVPWTLTGPILERIERNGDGTEYLPVDEFVLKKLEDEEERRAENRQLISLLKSKNNRFDNDPVINRLSQESEGFLESKPETGSVLSVIRVAGDPAHVKARIDFASSSFVKDVLGKEIKWSVEDLYGYQRAFTNETECQNTGFTVLDPTAGGGSIPFEALRLGHKVIANELNPVASTILYATLDYPAHFGVDLVDDIALWGQRLLDSVQQELKEFYPFSLLPKDERNLLKAKLAKCPEIFDEFDVPEYDHVGLVYARQVTCPHCGGEAPLLNTCWLSKEQKDPWGVRIVVDGQKRNGKVTFETYRVQKGRGPQGEDPNFATVNKGTGLCVHCRQAITGEEIKAQARGESPHGRWSDRLYAVVAVRFEPKLDKQGQPQRFKTGPQKGEIKTQKIRFFRAPNEKDLEALQRAEARLKEKWDAWEAEGLIPTERIPEGNDMRPVYYGMPRWCDLFTPRQLLGHLTMAEGLNRLKPRILAELGEERGRAVITYLQLAMDKGLDYNSRQTRWEYTRGVVKGTFGRHDFSLKWTFGEMIFTGPNSGAAWGLSQIIDAYKGIAELAKPVHERLSGSSDLPLTILNGTAAHMPQISDQSVDLICMDPPYYNNVQYAELSDYFYVWQKRTLKDLYPDFFHRRLTGKNEEAVANPVRDGSAQKAKKEYERIMADIFRECRRVLKDEGVMTLMFTHKTQEAWETLATSLIEAGWTLTASFPVESESSASLHQKDMASAASSIFIACRKREEGDALPAFWKGIGGRGVQNRIGEAVREGLKEFEPLQLNPVDEMVACYGRALHVLSEHWPVMDGDESVGPLRAMLEASRVVAEHQVRRITGGRLSVQDLDAETAMVLTLFGVFGLSPFSYDEALSLSRSLNIALAGKPAGYRVEGRMIGINQEAGGSSRRSRGAAAEEAGYHAPLVRSGSKLRIARPEERNEKRLRQPQTDWDLLQGLIQDYRRGGAPVAHKYLEQHGGGNPQRVIDLLGVWAAEVPEEKLGKEAETLRYDLTSRQGYQR